MREKGLLVAVRRPCPDLEPDCFELLFCDACRCATDLRRGLSGDVYHCPICGGGAVSYGKGVSPGAPRSARRPP